MAVVQLGALSIVRSNRLNPEFGDATESDGQMSSVKWP